MTGQVIVMTGASGFIGRRLAGALRASGVTVRAPTRAELDLEHPDRAETILAGATTVCHLAAYIPRDHHDPAEAETCLRVNSLGTLALLRASIAVGVQHFVLFSSGNVYRAGHDAARESDPAFPSARAPYYLVSKLCAEVYADHFGQQHPLAVAIARLSSVYGPGMGAVGMVPGFAARLRSGERLSVQNGGQYRCDLVHVDDVVAAAQRLIATGLCGTFNIGSGRATTSLEVARLLADLLHRDDALIHVEPATGGAAASGFAALDIARARGELDYSPRPLRDGLANYLESLG